MRFPQSPALKRFLSDFTLGFSDGLTVPFALTAGLSSLGKTDTVISGGLAELCAGSISMGIGGYLAASDEIPSQTCRQSDSVDDEETRGILSYDTNRESDDISESTEEKSQSQAEELIRLHLKPLDLPHSVIMSILSTIQEESTGFERVALRLQSRGSRNLTDTLELAALPKRGVSLEFLDDKDSKYNTEKPYYSNVPFTKTDAPSTNVVSKKSRVTLHDIRGNEDLFSLDVHRFELVKHPLDFDQ
ncbi:hypothetical protein N0V84_005365 [Fusarium piperis]|uniref:Uncharacterized protein n=1 Tax=Fusarium piperis TaxID=1435070 RepID=A0A9W8WE99_9HYPO|nr:hypothetical protein N0V84_005365 [Fusarium piperis]